MPSRLNKRQQRELEELEALGGPSTAQIHSEEDAPVTKKNTTFSNVSRGHLMSLSSGKFTIADIF